MQGDVEQPALAVFCNCRQAADGACVQVALCIDQAQAPGAFGDQIAAPGQKGERPGVNQTFGDDLVVDLFTFGLEGFRLQGQGGHQQRGNEYRFHTATLAAWCS